MQFETFAPLSAIPGIRHAFSLRDSADATKDEGFESHLIAHLGYPAHARAEQVHGGDVAVVETPGSISGVDALITRTPELPLVIRCADCAPVYIVDRRTSAIGLIHSGKKGTIANIVGNTFARMQKEWNTQSADCVAFIGPSIGPCHYEMDIWSTIEQQLKALQIPQIESPHTCTACNLSRYYSYRAEKGQTGRMFALLVLTR